MKLNRSSSMPIDLDLDPPPALEHLQDLTPGNVLLKQDTESPIGVCGKITDFGLCSALNPGQTHISNISNGTPFYGACGSRV
jgi:serine/threonine protein kinase